MGIREDVLALADDVESTIGGCERCIADKPGGGCLFDDSLECSDAICREVAKRLREIVERDECEVTTVSAYDLLPAEDREAIAWVREHGGLEAVKASAHQGTMEHGYLLKVAEMLGTSIYDVTGNADALLEKLSERIMPEGMEWPTVDGKPVDFKTGYEPSLGVLEAVSIYNNGACQVMSHDGIIKSAKDIHIVKPKVLDADGMPLREGETVWSVDSGTRYTVEKVTDELIPIKCCSEMGSTVSLHPSQLIHERPDSWERIEEDAERIDETRLWGDRTPDARDLVRRAKKLAERGK